LRGELGESRLLPDRRHHVLLDHRQDGLTDHRAVVEQHTINQLLNDRVSRSDRCLILSLRAALNLASTFAFVAASVMPPGVTKIALGGSGVIGNVQIGPGSRAKAVVAFVRI
jgi:hypothetical protein